MLIFVFPVKFFCAENWVEFTDLLEGETTHCPFTHWAVSLWLIARGACVPVQHFEACDVKENNNKQTLDCFVCHCMIVSR